MARYSDEEYEFRKDCGEKKRTAASSHKQRTHCGKGGRVTFPSDFKTRKELNAMNGVCVTYKLGDPMKWEEFKRLPDDKKVHYITWIRDKFKAPDNAIAEMLGVNRKTLQLYVTDLKINRGKGFTPGAWDEVGFRKWAYPGEIVEEEVVEEINISISPMSWTAFKELPDEEKIAYIKSIREAFGANDTAIGEMMGVTQGPISRMMRSLGINLGKGSPLGGKHKWKREAFDRWAFPTKYLKTADDIAKEQEMKANEEIAEEVVSAEAVHNMIDEVMLNAPICEALEAPVSDVCEITAETDKEIKQVDILHDLVEVGPDIDETEKVNGVPSNMVEPSTHAAPVIAIPKSGSMTFESPACMAMATLQALLGSANVRLTVRWEVVSE